MAQRKFTQHSGIEIQRQAQIGNSLTRLDDRAHHRKVYRCNQVLGRIVNIGGSSQHRLFTSLGDKAERWLVHHRHRHRGRSRTNQADTRNSSPVNAVILGVTTNDIDKLEKGIQTQLHNVRMRRIGIWYRMIKQEIRTILQQPSSALKSHFK